MQLKSLNEIFEQRILRIPDYQRGYAWNEEHFEAFWEDLKNLDASKVHYTGVITLEPLPKALQTKWQDDEWLIEGLGYRPSYVVDGQQRLTTSMILIQSILESVKPDQTLNYQSLNEIRKRYIMHKAEDGIRQSYLFGYEVDNPSDEFLKTRIYGEVSSSNQHQHTLYTRNLANAKTYFKKQLISQTPDQIALLFKKLTQKLKFNLYEINEEIDVFVTFETMNNRGKKLSNLELLKNRLIYLSTLLRDHPGHEALRRKINDAWKTIYEHLGKNPDVSLNDDTFLRNHWIMYFKYTRNKGDDYIRFLLDKKFCSKNITHPESEHDRVSIDDIDKYVTSLQQSIRPWFYIHNPHFDLPEYSDTNNKQLLDRMNRLGFKAFRPLLLAAYVSKKPITEINELLKAAERFNFIVFTVSQRRATTGDSEFYIRARELLEGSVQIDQILKTVNDWIKGYFSTKAFFQYIEDKFAQNQGGFYGWKGLNYFLYEYEASLREKSKHAPAKLTWQDLLDNTATHVTIEHIFPQTPNEPYWVNLYGDFAPAEKLRLTHSLGNLVPLSIAKNSSLQNDAFPLKKNNGNGVGFYNGSASENEVAQVESWTAEQILHRGMALLNFMEKRWDIVLGDQLFKEKLLHLDFLHMKDEVPHEHLASESV